MWLFICISRYSVDKMSVDKTSVDNSAWGNKFRLKIVIYSLKVAPECDVTIILLTIWIAFMQDPDLDILFQSERFYKTKSQTLYIIKVLSIIGPAISTNNCIKQYSSW
jgi:hypothetical protein